MSVFQLKDWWTAKSCGAGEEEEVDMGAMALGNVDNAIPASRNSEMLDYLILFLLFY